MGLRFYTLTLLPDRATMTQARLVLVNRFFSHHRIPGLNVACTFLSTGLSAPLSNSSILPHIHHLADNSPSPGCGFRVSCGKVYGAQNRLDLGRELANCRHAARAATVIGWRGYYRLYQRAPPDHPVRLRGSNSGTLLGSTGSVSALQISQMYL